MATPTKTEILEKALELFHNDNGNKYITPEEEELKESGYFSEAQQILMQGENTEAICYAEQLAGELGFRLIPEKEHSEIIYYQLKNEKLREKLKQLETQPLPQPAQPQPTVNLNYSLEVPQTAIDIETEEEPEEIEEVKQPSKICTKLKPKIRNLGVILKLLGQLIKLYLKD